MDMVWESVSYFYGNKRNLGFFQNKYKWSFLCNKEYVSGYIGSRFLFHFRVRGNENWQILTYYYIHIYITPANIWLYFLEKRYYIDCFQVSGCLAMVDLCYIFISNLYIFPERSGGWICIFSILKINHCEFLWRKF